MQQKNHLVPGFLAIASLYLVLLASVAPAADWPRFRGADGTGTSPETELARSWGEQGPPMLWKQSIGDGFAGMAVVGDRIYTLELREGEQRVVALEVGSGKTVWSVGFGTDYQDANGFGHGGRSTPTVDGDTVYAVSADSKLLALAVEDGALRWKSDFEEQFAAKSPRFGYGASPVVLGELLVIEAGGPEGHSIVAFDKKTGEVRWSSLDDSASYATPLVVTIGGREQLVFNRRSGLMALAADNGELLWQHPSAPDAIVMPVFVPPNRFFISSAAAGDGGHMVRVDHGEEGFSAATDWSNPRFRNHFNNSVLVDGFLYGFDNATFRCVEAQTGEPRWAYRGYGKGSLVAADGLLFVLSDKGLLALVEATPEAFRELGRTQAMEGRSWTSPTLAAGRLYVRDHDEIVAFDVHGSGAAPAGPVVKEAEARSRVQLPKSAAEVVERYIAARGGAAAWKSWKSVRIEGTYSAFSGEAAFTELHQRTAEGERYRLDFVTLGGPTTWARDDEAFWWIFPMLGVTEAGRLDEAPADAYIPQLERRAELEPLLLRWKQRGAEVELLGPEKVGDRETVALQVTVAEGQVESWYLDPTTWLEVAVDSSIQDFSQGMEPMTQRAFYEDFREVEGLVLPHQINLEFGARLEEIQVEKVEIDGEVDESVFRLPAGEEKEAESP